MNTFSAKHQRTVAQFLSQCLQPLALVLDKQFQVKAWSGDPDYFGFDALLVGQDSRELLLFLVGLDLAAPETLQFIETPNGRAVHVHFIEAADEVTLILVDATAQRQQHALLQQKSNELALLQAQQSKLINHLQALEQELEQKRQQAEQANALKGRFIATMSHEFRSPLSAILGYTARLQTDQSTEPSNPQALNSIERAAEHLLSLVENLLDHAQIEIGHLQLNPSTTSISQILDNISSLFAALAEDKGIQFNINLHAEVPPYLLIDELRLRQILVNLIANAIKFTAQGAVSLDLSWAKDELNIRISDTGKGIAQADQARIFTAFEKLDQQAGTGLGLSIVQHLIHLMQGQISVDSRLGHGSCFELRLPAKAIALQPIPQITANDNLPSLASSSLKQVLLVEDDPDIMVLLQDIFAATQITTLLASNGNDALNIALADKPDLILLDLNLPDMTGFDVCKALRAQGFYQPIFIQSAMPLTSTKSLAIAAGSNEYLEKPLDIARLTRLIADYFPASNPIGMPLERQQQLQQQFQATLADKLERLQNLSVTAVKNHWDEASRLELGDFVHRLAGSAGLYGMPAMGQSAKQIQQLLLAYESLTTAQLADWQNCIASTIDLLSLQLSALG